MHNILLKIIDKKQNDLEAQKNVLSVDALKGKAEAVKSVSKFKDKLLHPNNSNVSIIAEIKLTSPTIAFLGSESDIIQRAIAYEEAGADAISFITEQHYFKGNTTFISELKAKVNIPILQKDFVIDPYQIYEAKMIGSDAILFIAQLVEKNVLKDFVATSRKIGIEPIVEINDEEDLEKALDTDTSFIAVNARDLRTFTVDISKACTLLEKIPEKYIKLGFSGINSSAEVRRYKKAGAKGVLVGTSLMKTANIDNFIKSLTNKDDIKVKICGIRTLEAAQAAIDSGADYLGFNFVPNSRRYIEPKQALEIIKKIRDNIQIVGIFQNADVSVVREIAKQLNLDFVQLHGQEDSEYVKQIDSRVIKAINSPSETYDYSVDYFLLDRIHQGEGKMVSNDVAKTIADKYPIFFAGGLTPQNIASIVEKIQPYAVDVAGGIETNGSQDVQKIKDFIMNAKGVLI
ncbi:MAG: hypothetical protein COZ34_01530 [Candidatus Pacebacteria bacterium CG_4_10_14_3_um_filter_34_15]|nr:MAG: hypothetical protein COV78_02825 [Candidatus Pacebacteria bacterium CG11_big_fil_rev_8_21_14_0_20_34_55]PIX81768.1 MAG: hypothetical protein COZ34_01530 [Candidatus Pacebacteria bacterium CG_4_10_14_3_um_filter_34_15]PJC43463.1 MAG: hypothetical protein CO039_03870 [Candidatus Pacebacteria bacterium CG_4_9_14_0_2_um_filter_34_50]